MPSTTIQLAIFEPDLRGSSSVRGAVKCALCAWRERVMSDGAPDELVEQHTRSVHLDVLANGRIEKSPHGEHGLEYFVVRSR